MKPEKCIFVGDGGSDELMGARKVGMRTVFTEYLESKELHNNNQIMKDADYYINKFEELEVLLL